MVFSTEGFFELATESWPGWDLKSRPLNSVQTLEPTELSGYEFNIYYMSIYIIGHHKMKKRTSFPKTHFDRTIIKVKL